MTTQRFERKKQFVDPAVQGALMLHIVVHWVFFLISAGALLLFVDMLTNDPRDIWQNLFSRHKPTILVVLVLTPIFIRDMCRLSNRFAGPMYRLRRAMHDLALGREVKPIHFRKRDFWQEMAVDFNQIAERLQALQQSTPDSAPPESSNSCDTSPESTPTELHTCES